MKKVFITVVLFTSCIVANAQDMNSKRGTPILPESGDWSIGADATSLIRYFGNFLSQAGNNNSSLSPVQSQTIVGKYMSDENTAFRIRFGINFGSTSNDYLVDDQNNTTDPNAKVTDTKKISSHGVTIGVGYEKSRGKGRLHGVYGGEFLVSLGGGSKTTYSYGNSFDPTTGQATVSDFDPSNPSGSSTVMSRTKESKGGSEFGIGLFGFIGAEYFFAPKMSLSAEYGWGLVGRNTSGNLVGGLMSSGEGETTSETATLNTTTGLYSANSSTSKTGKGSSFNFGVDDIGSITLRFYF
jgi:hypothetical protein